ncbi:hypothetical protein LNP80_22690 [Chryseobacterium sp. C-39]|uniref:Uncharacterized protein n=1 Tax=Chryseobacterium muglaense TaxID=2893752 RepID=A0A9Q3UZU3_9FLAO|nr:hypothetical protein [Chryseobacterium muglaense]MCC9037023.1 hypothetical protein [Chryseobacterium muglaense]
MNTFIKLKNTLDSMSNNDERKKYLDSIRKNPLIGRHDLLRIACNIMHDDNFIDSYYKVSINNSAKSTVKKLMQNFSNFLIKAKNLF